MTDLTALIDRLDAVSSTWLDPGAPPGLRLRNLLQTTAARWPTGWDRPGGGSGPPEKVLFPLLYTAKPQITTAAFHQLIDAASEASRTGARLLLLSVPAARSGPHPVASAIVARIAAVFTGHGLPVEAVGDVAEQALPARLVARACTTRYARRAVDLPDLLTAAAADSLGVADVVLTDGLIPGEHLKTLRPVGPLSRLHDRADPFAEPPPDAKKAPAGSDALWASAFTLGLTDAASPDDGRQAYVAALGRRVGPLWHQLRRDQLTGHYGAPSSAEPLRIRAGDHPRGAPVAVPLFGAPTIADGTRSLVAAAALAGPPTLLVDDLTPRFCYRAYAADDARARYRKIADEHGGQTVFLSDLPDLADRLDHALGTLTHADVRAAAGPRTARSRGALTGFDGVHLAVMGVACTTACTVPTLAVKSANVAHIQALAPLGPPGRLLTCTGTGDLATGDLRVPIHWITDTIPGAHL
ncbi:hypothetical protein ACWGCW_25840 [Streptomyces sp. NPDC054933]